MAFKFQRGQLWSVGAKIDGQRKVWATGTTDEAQAEIMRKKVELAIDEGKDPQTVFGIVTTASGGTTIASVIELYKKQADVKPKTLSINQRSWNKFTELTKTSEIKELERETIVKEFKDAAEKARLSSMYVSLCIRDIRKLVAYAVGKGLMTVNRFKGAKLPEADEVFRVLTIDEEKALIDVANPLMKRLILVDLATGLRLGQLVSMDWKQFDGRTNTLKVGRQKRQKERRIPILPVTLALMGEPKSQGLIFSEFDGKSQEQSEWWTEHNWRKTKKAAGIKGRLRFHDLRHTCASRLAQILTPAEVRDFFGWSSLAMVDKYVHTRTEDIRKKLEGAA